MVLVVMVGNGWARGHHWAAHHQPSPCSPVTRRKWNSSPSSPISLKTILNTIFAKKWLNFKFYLFHVSVVGLVSVHGRPQNDDLYKSISTVIKSLEDSNSHSPISQDIRSKIITKHNFIQTRNKKSHLDLPPEFVVSTNLHVSHDQKEPNNLSYRSGRSNQVFGTSRYCQQPQILLYKVLHVFLT